ncbi:MAG: hypothetical protein ACKVE4_02645 [Dissulfuribacterales bacterium]
MAKRADFLQDFQTSYTQRGVMDILTGKHISEHNKLYTRALLLAQVTVLYNIIEGLVSVFFAIDDETLSL